MRTLARHIAKLPVSDKNRLLTLVAEDHAARARMELLRGFGADPDKPRDSRPGRAVAELLDTAGGTPPAARAVSGCHSCRAARPREQQRLRSLRFLRPFRRISGLRG
jgi:hypothetical protein